MSMVGQVVGWGSEMPYAECVYAEGRVVAQSGAFLTILREDIAAEFPHYNPFVVRKVEHVWVVE